MLNQVIWTRCYPHRDLKAGGKTSRADGFGVYSMSRDLVDHPPVQSYDFLQNRLSLQNGAKEGSRAGMFNSYEYNMLSENVYSLTFEVLRPHCKELRKNGMGHRAGTFIKQCLVGKPQGYPFLWFGADVWNASARGEGEYYLEDSPDQEAEWLPQVPEEPLNGSVTPAAVRQFVDEGRAECVKAGLWYLLNQYSKNTGERKILLIKDIPSNVELWIAAMEYGLSPELAQKITFTTNRSKISAQADSVLFYYGDSDGNFVSPTRKENLIRTPYAMIVGIHPQDNFANVRVTPNSNFVMIDGTNKTTTIQPDQSFNSPYYQALVRYDEDILDFNTILSSLPLDSISGNLPAMYDAYMYLLDSNHKAEKWNYRQALMAMQTLFCDGISSNDPINGYLLNECMRVYSSFASEDEANGFAFAKFMWKIAVRLKRNGDVTGCLADRIMAGLSNLKNSPQMIINTWKSIRNGNALPMVRSSLPEIFNDSELPDLSKSLMRTTPTAAETVMDMFMTMLSGEQEGVEAIRQNNEKFNFVAAVVIASMNDKNTLYKILRQFSQDEELMNEMAMQIGGYLDKYKPADSAEWWETVIDISGGNLVSLCESICASKNADIDMVESLLASRITKSGTCDASLLKAFDRVQTLLKPKANTGVKFYTAWINAAKISDLPDIIQHADKAGLSSSAKKTIAEVMDNKVGEAESVSDTVYRKLQEFMRNVGAVSKSATLHDFEKNLARRRRVNEAIEDAEKLSEKKISMDAGLFATSLFETITDAGVRFLDSELHIQLLLMLQMDGTTLGKYVSRYVSEMFRKAGRSLPEMLVSLSEAATGTYKVKGYTQATVTSVQSVIMKNLQKELPNYYKSSLIEKVEKIEDVDEKARKKLMSILNKAEEEFGSDNPLGSVFKGLGGLFGRKDK